MRPDLDKYYCYQWCGRMRWACVLSATGRDCKWFLARSLGWIVPGRAESWGEYHHTLTVLLIVCHVISLESVCHVNSMVSCVCGALDNDVLRNSLPNWRHLAPIQR
jgi:hypothetical protein